MAVVAHEKRQEYLAHLTSHLVNIQIAKGRKVTARDLMAMPRQDVQVIDASQFASAEEFREAVKRARGGER